MFPLYIYIYSIQTAKKKQYYNSIIYTVLLLLFNSITIVIDLNIIILFFLTTTLYSHFFITFKNFWPISNYWDVKKNLKVIILLGMVKMVITTFLEYAVNYNKIYNKTI